MTISDRIKGGLWGAIVGDALGVPVEFTSRDERRRDPVTGMRGYGTHGQPAGTWSDDSSLLLCTVETLCDEYAPARLAGRFLAWQAHGYLTAHGAVFDIGMTTRTALANLRDGVDPEEAGAAGDRDNGNGSLMRILPVALRYAEAPVAEMLSMAHRVSALTHRHPRSKMACGLNCLMAAGLLHGMAPADAYRFMLAEGGEYYQRAPFSAEITRFSNILSGHLAETEEAAISSGGYVVHTLEAGLWCLLTGSSFEETVLKAVNLGEDTDTTGCVAGGLAGLHYGYDAIPAAWIDAIARKDELNELMQTFIQAISR